jgi:hypothetical protein
MGWLALARHHGLPTRLLDWTEGPIVAAFFAAYPPDGKDGAIWSLNPHLLNDRLMGTAGIFLPGTAKGAAELFMKAFTEDPVSKKRIAAVQPYEVDFRMLLQLSRFTVHDSKTAIEALIDDDRVLRKYTIPKGAKGRMAAELEALGLRRSSLFPDLETLAEFLAELRYKETPGAGGTSARPRARRTGSRDRR